MYRRVARNGRCLSGILLCENISFKLSFINDIKYNVDSVKSTIKSNPVSDSDLQCDLMLHRLHWAAIEYAKGSAALDPDRQLPALVMCIRSISIDGIDVDLTRCMILK